MPARKGWEPFNLHDLCKSDRTFHYDSYLFFSEVKATFPYNAALIGRPYVSAALAARLCGAVPCSCKDSSISFSVSIMELRSEPDYIANVPLSTR